MKTIQYLILLAALAVGSPGAEDQWRRVAFLGDAQVKSISGLVEVITPEARILRKGETAKVGQTLRIWRGAEIVLQMENSKGLIRAQGPVLLRLAPDTNQFERASLNQSSGFAVRALRGGGRYTEDGVHWRDLEMGITLAEGSQIRPFRDSIIDLYDLRARKAHRLTDHSKAVELTSITGAEGSNLVASKSP